MCQTHVDILAVLVEHGVGEIVVLVDDKVHRHPVLLGLVANVVEFLRGPVLFFHIFGKAFIEQTFITLSECVCLHAAIGVETLVQLVDGACNQ